MFHLVHAIWKVFSCLVLKLWFTRMPRYILQVLLLSQVHLSCICSPAVFFLHKCRILHFLSLNSMLLQRAQCLSLSRFFWLLSLAYGCQQSIPTALCHPQILWAFPHLLIHEDVEGYWTQDKTLRITTAYFSPGGHRTRSWL